MKKSFFLFLFMAAILVAGCTATIDLNGGGYSGVTFHRYPYPSYYPYGYRGGWYWNGAGYVCPRVDNPTAWTPGREMPRPGDGALGWAPACYR